MSSIARAAAPGAKYVVLVFDKRAFLEGSPGPRGVDEAELREAVSKYWTVDEVRPALIHANLDGNADLARFKDSLPDGAELPEFPKDAKGRAQLPAWLLRAHKA